MTEMITRPKPTAAAWWRTFGINAVVWGEQIHIHPELENTLISSHGFDKEGHPVWYINGFGLEFPDKELYAMAFGDEEKRNNFLRWFVQRLENEIRQRYSRSPLRRVWSVVLVNDFRNKVGPVEMEMTAAINQALLLVQAAYFKFVPKQVYINVPWWYRAYNRIISWTFILRIKSKMTLHGEVNIVMDSAGPSESADTLFKYVAPEQVPIQYGGLFKENDSDFTIADAVTEVTVRPTSKHTIEISGTEGGSLVWELRVLGWEVSYGAVFAPSNEDSYSEVVWKGTKSTLIVEDNYVECIQKTMEVSPCAEVSYIEIIQKTKEFSLTDEPYIKKTYKFSGPGKVVLNIDNATYNNKKLLYRYKENRSTEST